MKAPELKSTLLDYAINTTPDPLQASPQNGNPVYAALVLVVSNGSDRAISLESLRVTIPPELTDHLESILYNADPQRVWSITPASPGVFNILPVSGKPVTITTEGIVFQFFNIHVNEQVGTVQIGITELAAAEEAGLQDRHLNIPLTKFPYGFFFSNFTPQVPLVQEDQTVTLTWEGSNQAKYIMYFNDKEEDVTNVRKWVSPPLTGDITFLLRAVVVSQGETVVKDLTTTVIVANPQIQASSLQVNGLTNLMGGVKLGTPGASLTVLGLSNLIGGAVLGKDINSRTTVKGSLDIGAGGSLNVYGPFYSSATARFDTLTVSRTAYINDLRITGRSGNWNIVVNEEDDALVFSFGDKPVLMLSGHGIITSMTYGPDNELIKTQVLNG
jgi:hypothetical protein